MAITYVRRYKRAEAFLASRVPQLQPDSFSIELDTFAHEVNAHSGLVA